MEAQNQQTPVKKAFANGIAFTPTSPKPTKLKALYFWWKEQREATDWNTKLYDEMTDIIAHLDDQLYSE